MTARNVCDERDIGLLSKHGIDFCKILLLRFREINTKRVILWWRGIDPRIGLPWKHLGEVGFNVSLGRTADMYEY
jgi:hypothetical protein